MRERGGKAGGGGTCVTLVLVGCVPSLNPLQPHKRQMLRCRGTPAGVGEAAASEPSNPKHHSTIPQTLHCSTRRRSTVPNIAVQWQSQCSLLSGEMSSSMTRACPPSSRTRSPAAAAAIMVASLVPRGASGEA